MRLIKTLDEIKGIKKANQIIAKIYADIIPPYLKAGITTREIDKIIDDYIRSCGARPACIGVEGFYGPFPAATCISVNEEVVHGIPGDRVIKDGDIVSLDIVTELNGYYGDSAKTFAIGEIDEESKKLLEVTEKSREIGIEAAVIQRRAESLNEYGLRCLFVIPNTVRNLVQKRKDSSLDALNDKRRYPDANNCFLGKVLSQ